MHRQAGNSTKTNACNYLKQITEHPFSYRKSRPSTQHVALSTFSGTVHPVKPTETKLLTYQLQLHPVPAATYFVFQSYAAFHTLHPYIFPVHTEHLTTAPQSIQISWFKACLCYKTRYWTAEGLTEETPIFHFD